MTSPGTADVPQDRLAALQDLAVQVLEEIGSVSEDGGKQFDYLARRARVNRRMLWITLVAVAAALVATAVMAWNLSATTATTHRLDILSHRLDVAQTTTRQKTLCPLYTLFKSTETPAARAAAPDKAAYDRAVLVIQGGYDALNCAADS